MGSTSGDGLVAQLQLFGFSQYEAQAYLGLLRAGGQTGYALSKVTGIPQPKVYETLRRLVDRGVAVQLGDGPARFAAVPAAAVLSDLEAQFQRRLDEVRQEFDRLQPEPPGEVPQVAWSLNSLEGILARATDCVGTARRKIYLSGRSSELRPLAEGVRASAAQGVEVVMLHFGPSPFPLPRGRAYRHRSTEGMVYPRHQARHLAVVADSSSALWAVAADGRTWRALYSEDRLFAAVVKAYIRHDVFVQRIYADLREPMQAAYGPGLERLGDLSGSRSGGSASARPRDLSAADGA